MTNNVTESDTDHLTMDDVSHTNPYTGETAGRLFSRGPTVVTDGGEREPSATDPNASTDDEKTMRNVDHTPPNDAEDANRVFERGQEPADTVEDEE